MRRNFISALPRKCAAFFFRISRSMRRRSFSRRRRAFSAAKSAPAGGIAACVLERRGDPACPPSPLFRQARSLEAAIPSSWAIWLKGRPLLASSPTASRLNSSVNCRRAIPIKHLPAPTGAYQRCPPFRGRVTSTASTSQTQRPLVLVRIAAKLTPKACALKARSLPTMFHPRLRDP